MNIAQISSSKLYTYSLFVQCVIYIHILEFMFLLTLSHKVSHNLLRLLTLNLYIVNSALSSYLILLPELVPSCGRAHSSEKNRNFMCEDFNPSRRKYPLNCSRVFTTSKTGYKTDLLENRSLPIMRVVVAWCCGF